jgi:hypothetical protein
VHVHSPQHLTSKVPADHEIELHAQLHMIDEKVALGYLQQAISLKTYNDEDTRRRRC